MRLSFTFRTPLSRALLAVAIGAALIAISWASILQERQYQRDGRIADGVVLTKTSEVKTSTRLIGGGFAASLVLRRGLALSPSPATPNPAL